MRRKIKKRQEKRRRDLHGSVWIFCNLRNNFKKNIRKDGRLERGVFEENVKSTKLINEKKPR